jgi:hypothetical protein
MASKACGGANQLQVTPVPVSDVYSPAPANREDLEAPEAPSDEESKRSDADHDFDDGFDRIRRVGQPRRIYCRRHARVATLATAMPGASVSWRAVMRTATDGMRAVAACPTLINRLQSWTIC